MGYTWEFELKIYKYTILSMAVIAVGLALLIKSPLPFIIGLLFGTLISILNFRDLALTLHKAVLKPPAHAQIYTASRYFTRLIINGVVIFVSIRADYIHVIGTIIGLLLIKFVIMAMNLFSDKLFFKKIFTRKEED